MTGRTGRIAGGAAIFALGWHLLVGWGPDQAEGARRVAAAPADMAGATRQAFFGELHLHTAFSLDAYVAVGSRTTPEQAYRFARGQPITYMGQSIQADRPLDFLAVCDHSESMGVLNQLDDPQSAFSKSDIGRLAREGGLENTLKIMNMAADGIALGPNEKEATASAWQRSIAAANANYVPGQFTSFICYEWTSMPGGNNLHRNVVFRGDNAPLPFTALNSARPEDLWAWLGRIRATGFDAIAIPHNSNASNGMMFGWNKSDGTPIDRAYAQLRMANEPLLEVTQMKGTSEVHPGLAPNDEFANFEVIEKLLDGSGASKAPGSYWRDALGRGLVIGASTGENPYKLAPVGASDFHGGVISSRETDFGGQGNVNLGGGRFSEAQARQILGNTAPYKILQQGSAGLTGVWAEANTREAIFAALRRKETFATSGTRIRLRMFGAWNLPANLPRRHDWTRIAYARGVPMGGELPARSGNAPRFAMEAVKDPVGANLDRIQIVKVWLSDGKPRERIFDVAWSGDRKPDPVTGRLADVGNTVDLRSGRFTEAIGASRLATLWTDPTFRPGEPAVYYGRVLEIPTPRWSTLRAIEHGLPPPAGVASTIQERAWSAPIWYDPRGSR